MSTGKRGRPPRQVPANPQLEKQLRAVSARIERHRAAAAALEPERDQLIRQAAAEGWPHEKIATLASLKRPRIGQIVSQ